MLVIISDDNCTDLTRVISLNKTAAYLWQSLEGEEFNQEDIIKKLTAKYGIDFALAQKDAFYWVENMIKMGLIN